MNGARNHRRVAEPVAGQSETSTTFHIMAAATRAGTPAAEANITAEFAAKWSGMLVKEGDTLVAAMREAGILSGASDNTGAGASV